MLGKTLLSLSIILTIAGCRAFKEDTATSKEPTGTASSSTSSTPPKPAEPPKQEQQPIDIKGNINADLLKEALGRNIIPLLDPSLTSYLITFKNSDATSSIETGLLTYNQILTGKQGGKLTIKTSSDYQTVALPSGVKTTLLGPATVDITSHDYSSTTACGRTYSLNGHIRCTLKGDYNHTAQKLNINGHCYTHTDGTGDNIRFKLANDTHRVRYSLGVTIKGSGRSTESYTWLGSALIDGMPMEATHSITKSDICD